MLAGMLLTLLVGPVVAVPAPDLIGLLETVSVTHSDEGKSGFQLGFRLTRAAGLPDYLPLLAQRLKIGTRVILVVTLNAVPQVLMDGLITQHQLAPGDKPNTAMLSVTGEDLSALMNLVEVQLPHVATNAALVTQLLAPFATYGVVPVVIQHADDLPVDTNTAPQNPRGKILEIIQEKARLYDYTFFVFPGPAPGMSLAYFGPRLRVPIPQRAMTMNMGASTNVTNLSFTHDGNAPLMVVDLVKDDSPYVSAPPLPVLGMPSKSIPLAALPSVYGNAPYVQVRSLGPQGSSSYSTALRQAMAEATNAGRRAVTAQGEVDGARYGMVLYARGLVGVRGAGLSYDGLYYVKSVSHSIKRGEYKQSFNLQREGVLPTVPAVRP